MTDERVLLDKKSRVHKPDPKDAAKRQADGGGDASGLTNLQQQVGNRAVQRLIAQRSGDAPYTLDEETEAHIDRERGGGQPIEPDVERELGTRMGYDFRDVQVHTSPEADTINRQVGARAFTTGTDIFFREGHYQPNTSEGQELLAHELTHVVQQTSGEGPASSGGLTVNAPDDRFEQQANSVAKEVSGGGGADMQRAAIEEEEETLQTAAIEEEEETLQTAAIEEEEETLQTKRDRR